jgi:drug/metabolite transporter (DMT)-like permease
MRKTSSFGWIDIALLGVVVIWGVNFTVVKSALAEMTPLAYDAVRFSTASLFSLILARVVERDLHIARRDWAYVFLLSLIGNFLYQILYINGLARSRAGNTSLILSTSPIFVAIFGTLTGQERLRWRNWLGIFLSFLGIYLLVVGSRSGLALNSETLLGSLLVLAAASTWGLYTVLLKPLVQRYSPTKATAWIMSATTPLLVLAALPDIRQQDWGAVSPQSWLGLLFSSALAIAIAYVIWNTGVRRVGSARTAVYNYLTPLISVVVAWIVLGEAIRPVQALGAVAIVLGVVLGRYRPNAGTPPRADGD